YLTHNTQSANGIFFFSSRRRHTSFKCDWSSDVCSSDLGGSVGACTGTLLNDQANDQKPYFLTANHCISTQTEAQSANVYWNYNSGEDPTAFPSTHGANLLVTGTSSDFTFLLLTGSVPGGLFFSGWEATHFAGSVPGS